MSTPDRLPAPNNTASVFSKVKSSNVGLLFDRYLRFVGSHWEMAEYEVPRPGKKPIKRSAKLWNLEQIVEAQKQLNQNWQKAVASQVVTRWHNMVKSQGATPVTLTPEWRFVVGLGDKTALEVGFTFHRIYGFPVIPGSALKGLARAAALSQIADTLGVPRLLLHQAQKRANHKPRPLPTPIEKLEALLMATDARIQEAKQLELTKKEGVETLNRLREEKGLENLDLTQHEALLTSFRTIFGTPYAAGEAIFFDAMPAAPPVLEIDVMNVHYPEYYGGDNLPTDNQNPNPIPFLTVGRSPFSFAVGWRNTVNATDLHQAEVWLKAGLSEFGVGAKTAAGYGYFQ